VVSLSGAALGLFFGWLAVNVLQHVSELQGYFHPTYDAAVFGRALSFAIVVAVLGALYPAIRAARLAPLAALRRE
jgi:ABC-type antimicrobial peptide transport system permease subunit